MCKHELTGFTFRIVPEIIFGCGVADRIGVEIKKIGAKKVLIVSDSGIKDAGLIDKIEKFLRREGISNETFTDVPPEPWVDVADEAGSLARKCDLVLGLGGGSVMDIAKAASVLAKNEGKASDYQGLNKVPAPGLPKIMMPTTAGTGSEITFTSVLSNRPVGKGGINSPYLFPEVALLDPLLTLSMPAAITAATGMDALTHAIEGYTSKQANPITDIFALQAIELISKNLPIAFKDGGNLEVRENMLLGSLLGGITIANAGVGATHALAYPLGGFYRVPHGISNALLLPYVMEFNCKAAEQKFACIARAMGENINNFSLEAAAQVAIAAVRKLLHNVGIPDKIKGIGVEIKEFEEIATAAMGVNRPLENNPRKLTPEDAIKIYKQAY
jgi:alcohol dehydrogenase